MKLMNKILTLCSLGMLVSVLGCGHPTVLQSIAISPSSQTLTAPSLAALEVPYHFTAVGTFVTQHENKLTETVNISDSRGLTWAVDPPSFATVVVDSATGNFATITPTGDGCGTILITATAQGAVGPGTALQTVIGTTTLDLIDTGTDCSGTQAPDLTVAVSGVGEVSGFINGATTTIAACTQNGGLNCVATGILDGTTVELETSAPATFSPNCTVITTTSCDVVLNGTENVTVTFP